MAAYVDIANLALAHLGDDATLSSLDEASAQAGHCKRFLPIARDTLLELHPWKFAVRRTNPALLTPSTNAWQYAYQEPANCIRVLGILPDGYTNDQLQALQFETESVDDNTTAILCNWPNATLRYIARVENPARFTPLFTEALAWLLASYVAGPLIKGTEGQQAAGVAWQSFIAMFARASGSNANQAKIRLTQEAGWIMARGGLEYNGLGTYAELGPVRG